MSNPSIQAFHRPRTVERVWQLLEEGGPSVRLVGGGTDLAIRCPPEVHALAHRINERLGNAGRNRGPLYRPGWEIQADPVRFAPRSEQAALAVKHDRLLGRDDMF